jgi:1-acyl-sn-glycerol-3-phosphate acyltransferase
MSAIPEAARPAAPASSRGRRFLLRVAGPVGRRIFRVRIEGDEHLPATGGAIIAANHLSFFDSIALALAVPDPSASSARPSTSRAGRPGGSSPPSE